MEFRPCIDIHNGKVKQIVGGSLTDEKDQASENYVSERDASWYADLYKKDHLTGGHVILLNAKDSPYYNETKAQALAALRAYPGGLQVGGGITDENAAEFLNAGASHVIVTSFVFREGRIDQENLSKIVRAAGKEHLVLDLSCRKKDDGYYIVTDRWQRFANEKITEELLDELAAYADEFLIHGVDVEGKKGGIEEALVTLLGGWKGIPVTYAGGIGSLEDLAKIEQLGKGRVNATVGSALDLFGGTLSYRELVLQYT